MEKYKMIMCVVGIVAIAVGIITTKVKRNSIIGLRTPWSMYNDITWKKSNKIGGILMAIAGILIAISAFVFEEKVCLTVSLVVIVIVSAIALVLSKRIYEEEKKKEQSGNN